MPTKERIALRRDRDWKPGVILFANYQNNPWRIAYAVAARKVDAIILKMMDICDE